MLQVLIRKGYGMECDVWSAGVILYITLCGTPPFDQETVEAKFNHIKRAEFSFPDAQVLESDQESAMLFPRCTGTLMHRYSD